jgi:hypothetical protein
VSTPNHNRPARVPSKSDGIETVSGSARSGACQVSVSVRRYFSSLTKSSHVGAPLLQINSPDFLDPDGKVGRRLVVAVVDPGSPPGDLHGKPPTTVLCPLGVRANTARW